MAKQTSRLLMIGLMLAGSFSSIASRPTGRMNDPVDSLHVEIDRLEDRMRRSADPDSIRLAMATLYRRIGDPDARGRALELLKRLRRARPADPQVFLELGRTYLEGGRRMDGRRILSTLARARPEEVEVRLTIADLLIQDMLRYRDLHDLQVADSLLEEVIAQRPGDQAGRYLKALCLFLSQGTGGDRLRSANLARDHLKVALGGAIPDLNSGLLDAVLCLALGEDEEAELRFQWAIGRMSAEDASLFLVPEGLQSHSTRSPPLTSGANRIAAYWDAWDPTPLTLRNEALLRYWSNLVAADLLFGDRSSGVRGWNTAPGRAIARFGIPGGFRFFTGRFPGAGGPDRPRLTPSWYLSALDFAPSLITIAYPSGFRLTFLDPTLQGRWVPDDPSAAIMQEARRSPEPVLLSIPTENPFVLYARCATDRSGPSDSREGCVVCLPPWGSSSRWWEGASLLIRVLDHRYEAVGTFDHLIIAQDLHQIEAGRSVIVCGQDFQLEPGEYTAEIEIRQDERVVGGRLVPFFVERFAGDGLQISDLVTVVPRLSRGVGSALHQPPLSYLPDPTATIGPEGKLEIAFSVYNLVSDGDGRGILEVRYLIVPADYRRADAKRQLLGKTDADPALRYGTEGDRIGGVELTRERRYEVLFPPSRVEVRGPDSVVRRSASFDLSRMPAGSYVLRVEVTDRIADAGCMAEIAFGKVDQAERARMLAGAHY